MRGVPGTVGNPGPATKRRKTAPPEREITDDASGGAEVKPASQSSAAWVDPVALKVTRAGKVEMRLGFDSFGNRANIRGNLMSNLSKRRPAERTLTRSSSMGQLPGSTCSALR